MVDLVLDAGRHQAVGVPPTELSVTVAWTPDNKSGSQVKVQLSYSFSLFISALMPIPDIQLTRSSAMVIF